MLLVELVGDSREREAVRARFRAMGASVGAVPEAIAWDVARAGIWIWDGEPSRERPDARSAQLVVGAGTSSQPSSEADVWIEHDGVERLWSGRLAPFEENLRTGRRAPRRRRPVLSPPDPTWAVQAERLIGRLRAALGDRVLRVDHIGSTSVPGLAAKDLIDIQVVVADLSLAGAVAEQARRAGFVRAEGTWFGEDRFGHPHPEEIVVDADPGRPANVNIRPAAGPVWREALLFRDWLRTNAADRDAYADLKRSLAADPSAHVDRYGADKMPWIRAALERAQRKA
jgi:GrpB-like predicted nucleotidyltransferase (UPF0157 family)